MTDNISSIIHKPTKDTSEETFLKGFFLVTYSGHKSKSDVLVVVFVVWVLVLGWLGCFT